MPSRDGGDPIGPRATSAAGAKSNGKRRAARRRLAIASRRQCAIEWLPPRILLSATPTSITVSTSAASAVYGQAVSLTAHISASPSSPSEGNVAFFDNGAALETRPVTSGAATLDNVHLPAGRDQITASYSDTGGNFASSSTTVASNPMIETIAGGLGDGSPAIAASIGEPTAVAVDSSGNLFISDTYYVDVVHKVDHATGVITTVAGNGTYGFGGDGGAASAAELAYPSGLAVDSSGNLFIADTNNSRIREVDHATGIITTVAGNGTDGFSGDGGPATAAELNRPTAVAVDSSGHLFIADTNNNRIRELDLATHIVTTRGGKRNGRIHRRRRLGHRGRTQLP